MSTRSRLFLPLPQNAHSNQQLISKPEFGNTTDVEKSINISSDGGATTATEWLDLANGCICCSVKDSGVNAIESLMERRGAFDYILLETTGLADPGNIAPVFWVDEGLGSTIYLDGIVTLVDAKNLLKSLEEPQGEEKVHDEHEHAGPKLSIAHLQISHADVVIINKTDLVTPAQLDEIESRVRGINSLARIEKTDHSQIPELEGTILDLKAYTSVNGEDLTFAEKGHSHLDPAIGTVTVTFPVVTDSQLSGPLDAWLRSVLWEGKIPGHPKDTGWEVFRTKGRIVMPDGRVRMLQGVREIFELGDSEGATDGDEAERRGKIVFIGRNLGGEGVAATFQHSLDAALVSNP